MSVPTVVRRKLLAFLARASVFAVDIVGDMVKTMNKRHIYFISRINIIDAFIGAKPD
jgi:hypothetical protein